MFSLLGPSFSLSKSSGGEQYQHACAAINKLGKLPLPETFWDITLGFIMTLIASL